MSFKRRRSTRVASRVFAVFLKSLRRIKQRGCGEKVQKRPVKGYFRIVIPIERGLRSVWKRWRQWRRWRRRRRSRSVSLFPAEEKYGRALPRFDHPRTSLSTSKHSAIEPRCCILPYSLYSYSSSTPTVISTFSKLEMKANISQGKRA